VRGNRKRGCLAPFPLQRGPGRKRRRGCIIGDAELRAYELLKLGARTQLFDLTVKQISRSRLGRDRAGAKLDFCHNIAADTGEPFATVAARRRNDRG
jgi:hypothetical protein